MKVRKKSRFVPRKGIYITELVCEGCGALVGAVSVCTIAVQAPVEESLHGFKGGGLVNKKVRRFVPWQSCKCEGRQIKFAPIPVEGWGDDEVREVKG